MLISIAAVAAVLCAIVLVGLVQSERRKPYNEFHQPAATASAVAIYGDTGGAGGLCGGGGEDGGGC